jgi:hypothetical protein
MHMHTSTQTGRMTAVMRAVRAQPQAKVLRVGMLVEGRIVEERIVKESFVHEGVRFEHGKDGYRLVWSRGITGRVAIDGRIVDLSGEGSLALDDDARGKVVVGKLSLLFQLVEPPPAQSRPQLPLAVKAGLPVDWRLTIIAALSFLAHFGFVGALYSDWTDGTVDTSVDVAGLVDLSRVVPQAVPLETPTEHPTTTNTTTSTNTNTNSNTNTNTNHADPNAHAAALSRQAEAMQMQLLAAFGGETAVIGALDRSNIPIVNLDEAAQKNIGAKPGDGLKLATNDGIITRPGDEHDLSRLGVTERGPDQKVIAHDVKGPTTTIDFTVKDPIGNVPVRNVEAVVAMMRPSFRSCYNKGIQTQPDMQGKVVFRVRLAPNGEVTAVDEIDGAGLSDGVKACTAKVIWRGNFDGPGRTGSKFDLPISFITQNAR